MQPRLNFFHICEYASLSENKKLNILGIFQNINAPAEPIVHPMVAFVLNVSVFTSGGHKIVIKIFNALDKERKPVAPVLEFFPRVEALANGAISDIGVIGQVAQIEFPKFGDYIVQASVDEFDLVSRSLSVTKRSS